MSENERVKAIHEDKEYLKDTVDNLPVKNKKKWRLW
jgi:hypothetical protein